MSAVATPTKIRVRILRQAAKNAEQYWDEFEVTFREKLNVISVLMEIQKNPVTINQKEVHPPSWEAACLEEVCGSCTMNINGRIRQACTALIEEVCTVNGDTYELELQPMKKFPLIRDLVVDRSKMFENLIKVKAWVPIDGSYDLPSAARLQSDEDRPLRYALSRCMSCGCCLEVCPQVSEKTNFVGPAALGQALLFNRHPVGSTLANERLDFLTTEEGISNCGNAQNCVKVCPKSVPLTRAIAELNRDTTIHKLKQWVGLA